MPRPATIALENEEGSIKQVDITWSSVDAEPLGQFIVEHYSDVSKLKSLLEQGDICTLGKEVGEPNDINDMSIIEKGWTRFYARDGGALDASSTNFSSIAEYTAEIHEGEHHYIYRNISGDYIWYYGREDDGLILLDPVLTRKNQSLPESLPPPEMPKDEN